MFYRDYFPFFPYMLYGLYSLIPYEAPSKMGSERLYLKCAWDDKSRVPIWLLSTNIRKPVNQCCRALCFLGASRE